MVVQHNISAMTANRYYGINNKGLASSLEKLASGYSINKAGDNAAGLAVSEKMRAQIGGLTQASKNAEDGISLVQTFEGALQETDSILQRMRTLAVQSANGSYQDDVDREAMQLEFDQLNDELNQIADTDFNGVVMLNGGEMADGLKAIDGKFDYENKPAQVISKAQELADNKFVEADAAYKAALKKFNSTNYDLTENGQAPEWNTVNNNYYNKDIADEVWKTMGIVNSSGDADTSKITSVDVTFESDGQGGWKAIKGIDNFGDEVIGATNLTADEIHDGDADTTGEGGFNIKAENDTTVNLEFLAKGAKKGDTVTVTFTNDTEDVYAPANIAFNQDSVKVSDGATGIVMEDGTATDTLSVALPTTLIKDSEMSQELYDAFSALEDMSVTVEYTAHKDAEEATWDDGAGNVKTETQRQAQETATAGSTATWTQLTAAKDAVDGEIVIKLKGAGKGEDDPYDLTITNSDGTAPTKARITGKDGKTVELDVTAADGKLTFSAKDKTGTAKELMTLNIADYKATGFTEGDVAKDGTVSANVSVSSYAFTKASNIKVTPGDNKELDSSLTPRKELDAAKAARDKALEDQQSITDFESANKYLGNNGVSKSDAFDQSRATMTYTDSMSLQVGARTKDEVNFTFSYQSNGLGNLKANLNCSSRTDGLGTADLSISTQKSANDAIDKIDNAINKVNMVRATFGAAQNRLEHKINNIDTNTENLTAAESRIRDTQMDKEMMKFTSAQILSQASQSMLAQANSLPQGVLQLLG